jgi:hypothetical protein
MPDQPVPVPGRILAAGDWHGNTRWAERVIWKAETLLADEEHRIVLHLGDFGVWPGCQDYLFKVSAALEQADAVLYFVDGNHEDHDQLDELSDAGFMPPPLWLTRDGRIRWLPRGYRWTWHGRRWLALGGGVSLDRVSRIEGAGWWPQEEITDEQEAGVIAAGPADVMVTHDCPAGIRHVFPQPPSWWDLRDLARSDAHRDRLQRVVGKVQPSHLMHGHLHIAYQRTCDFGYGPVQVTGLDADGKELNYAVLDTRTMEWEAPGA